MTSHPLELKSKAKKIIEMNLTTSRKKFSQKDNGTLYINVGK